MGVFGAFSRAGRWFRGNCHTHTTLSDGKSSAAAVATMYRRAGYHFLFLTDHRKAQPEVDSLCRRGFLALPGIELHPAATLKGFGVHHIIGLGIRATPNASFMDRATAGSVIRWIERQGGIPVYGHPYWTGHDIRVMNEGRRALGMEVFNSVCETTRGLGDSGAQYDQALTLGMRWAALAVDDLHEVERDRFGGWIMLKAAALTERAILDAIRRRRFYATQGPVIQSLTLRRNVARIECSPVRRIVWHSRGPAGVGVTAGRALLTRHAFDVKHLAAAATYLRVEITDAHGLKAWSNPVWRNPAARRWEE